MTTLTTSSWGDPAAPKHALLVHGVTSSSQSWCKVAPALAAKGYLVTAPDLLGHGNADKPAAGDYTIAALAQQLQPLFPAGNDHPYHVVVGHSLGGLVVAALLPLLSATHPVHVVLVDPPLEQTNMVSYHKRRVGDLVRNPKTPEVYLAENPLWSVEAAIARAASIRQCDVATVEAIFDQNTPWSFSRLLLDAPDNVRLTILAADPSKRPCVKEDDFKQHPRVTAQTVWGASHMIPYDAPQVVVATALQVAE